MISLFQNDFFKKLNKNWIFEYLIIILYMTFGILGWTYSFSIAGMGIVSIALILIFIFNDFKYLIPAIISLLFSNNGGFDSSSFPAQLAGYAGLLVIIALIYTIYNFKLANFKKPRSYIGIIGLAITTILPIFWNDIIPSENWMMYFVYFGWLLFLLLYIIFGINFTEGSLRTVIFTFSTLALLISLQCIIQILRIHEQNPDSSIFDFDLSFGYTVGWGLCNEAGIMLCFCIPFIFIELVKSKNICILLFDAAKVGISALAILFTTSRGALAVGAFEILILFILLMIFSKRKIINLIAFLALLTFVILVIGFQFGFDRLYNDVVNKIFSDGISGNGRTKLYVQAFDHFKEDPINMIFGSGIVSDIEERFNYNHWQVVYIVYHSTFFQEMVTGGILGLLCLFFHFFEKYKQLYKKEKAFALIMLIGYLLVDLYGMIDNTYGMYYYMIPLIMVMVALDIDKNTDIFNYENKELNVL